MKKGYYSLCTAVLLLCLIHGVSAQQFLVNKQWSFNEPGQVFYQKTKVKTNSNKDVFSLGSVLTASNGFDILLVKTDKKGDTVYVAQFDGDGHADDYAADLYVSPSGSVYIVGGSWRNAADSLDPVLVKLNPDGSFDWRKYYSSSSSYNDGFTSIEGYDNHLFLGGTLGTANDKQDYLIVKFDTSSAQVWSNTYDYQGFHDAIVKVDVSPAASFITVSGASQPNSTDWDYCVQTYSKTTGALGKDKRFTGGTMTLELVSDLEYANNQYYITGSEYNAGTGYDMALLVLDDSLELVYKRTYNGADNVDDKSNGLSIDLAGNVYVTGYEGSSNFTKKMVTIKYDYATGNQLWKSTYNSQYPGGSASGQDIEVKNNNVYIGGYEYNPQSGGYLNLVCYDVATGAMRWQKQGANGLIGELDMALDNQGDILFTMGVPTFMVTEKYSVYENPNTAVTDTTGRPVYKANELIVSFNPDKVNPAFVNDPDKMYANIEEVIDSALVIEMGQKIGVPLYKNREAQIIKIFNTKTWQTTSTSRSGRLVPMPKFWAILTLRLPTSVNEIAAMDSLSSLSGIYYAELNGTFQTLGPDDPQYNSGTQQSSLHHTTAYPDADINVDSVWQDYEIGKDWVKLGVLDRGILFTHEDMGDGTFGGTNSKVKGGHNFDQPLIPVNSIYYNSSTPTGWYEHGTEVAGIIGASTNNGIGVAGISGGDADSNNIGVSLYDMRVCCATGSSADVSYLTRLADAIVEGAASGPEPYNGLHIMNLSLGAFNHTSTHTLRLASIFARSNEVVMVTARGHIGIGQVGSAADSTIWLPACYDPDWMISVGASGTDGIRLDDNNGPGALPTNYATAIGRGMDFIAPGALDNVYTTNANVNNPGSNTTSYTSFGMTSSACAHVSGVASLMLADFQGRSQFPDNLNMEDIEHILAYTAYNHRLDTSRVYTAEEGWGLINANEALKVIQKPYYSVLHFTAWLDTNAITLEETDISGVPQGLDILDYETQASTPISNGENIDQYKIAAVIPHGNFISPAGQILGYWVRNSYSDALGDYYFTGSGVQRFLNGWSDVNFEYFTQDSAKIYGYVYRYTSSNPDQWFPANFNFNWQVRLSYTVHVYDSTAVTSVEPEENDLSMLVYPNPASQILNLQLKLDKAAHVVVEITDMQGRKLYSFDNGILPAGGNIISVPVQSLADGNYFVSLITDNNRIVEKFMKQ